MVTGFSLADVRGGTLTLPSPRGRGFFASNVIAGGLVEGFVGLAAAAGEGFFGRAIGNQTVAAVADQIVAAGLLERFADLEIVLRLEELQQGALQAAVAEVLGDVDRLHGERIDAGVVHAGGDVERGWG